MHYFSFEISNAPDWCEDVRRCRTGLNPHFLFVLPKRLPGFPAELYRFGTEKPGGYSLLKRECPPRPPKEKRGGISISPRTPLKRHKGAGCGPNTVMAIRFPALMGRQSCHFLESTSLYPPPGGALVLSPLEIPPKERRGSDSGKRSRGRPICNTCVRRTFWCGGRTDLRFEYSAAGRGVSSLVGSAWRPTSVLG